MTDIETIVDNLLKEPIDKYMLDSGGVYGYRYEKNRNEGILKGLNPVEEYTTEENKTRELEITIPVYDLLTYNLTKDSETETNEQIMFQSFKECGFEPYEIYEVEDWLKKCSMTKTPLNISESSIAKMKYVNTYNYEEYISQTLLYIIFQIDGEEYVLLEVHNGCDVRSGYTKPQLFKITDVEYFLMGMSYRFCQCGCGLNDYTIFGDDPADNSGAWIGDDEIYERTYIDSDGNVRCKECNEIIKGGFFEW